MSRNIDDDTSSRGLSLYAGSGFFQLGQVGDGGSLDRYGSGVSTSSGLTVPPSITSGISETFGYTNNFFYVPGSVPLNGIYTPSSGQSVTWVGETLDTIGLGGLTTSPTTVWNNPNASGFDGAFQFVNGTVPEPTSALMLSMGGFVCLIRRRRS